MNANKNAVHTDYSLIQTEGLESSNFRPDIQPSLELNPLAAGNQTPFEKGELPIVLMV
jgi:hypothetical protein